MLRAKKVQVYRMSRGRRTRETEQRTKEKETDEEVGVGEVQTRRGLREMERHRWVCGGMEKERKKERMGTEKMRKER